MRFRISHEAAKNMLGERDSGEASRLPRGGTRGPAGVWTLAKAPADFAHARTAERTERRGLNTPRGDDRTIQDG